jgi:hypothetical protein
MTFGAEESSSETIREPRSEGWVWLEVSIGLRVLLLAGRT